LCDQEKFKFTHVCLQPYVKVIDDSAVFKRADECAFAECSEYILREPETVWFLSSVAETVYDDRLAYVVDIS